MDRYIEVGLPKVIYDDDIDLIHAMESVSPAAPPLVGICGFVRIRGEHSTDVIHHEPRSNY